VENVIAIELLAACQAIEFLRPLKTTVPLEEVYKLVRSVARRVDKRETKIAVLTDCTFYSRPWDKDRFMAPDIEAVTNLLKEGKIWSVVRHHVDFYHAPQVGQLPQISYIRGVRHHHKIFSAKRVFHLLQFFEII
jgi:histidine ammonia-lyase